MGILSVGSVTLTIASEQYPHYANLALQLDVALWIIGTIIGIITALAFAVLLVGRDVGAPSTVWGLAVVGPMVSATVGGGIAAKLLEPHTQATFWS